MVFNDQFHSITYKCMSQCTHTVHPFNFMDYMTVGLDSKVSCPCLSLIEDYNAVGVHGQNVPADWKPAPSLRKEPAFTRLPILSKYHNFCLFSFWCSSFVLCQFLGFFSKSRSTIWRFFQVGVFCLLSLDFNSSMSNELTDG